jgi:hypothetical protein
MGTNITLPQHPRSARLTVLEQVHADVAADVTRGRQMITLRLGPSRAPLTVDEEIELLQQHVGNLEALKTLTAAHRALARRLTRDQAAA